MAMLRNGAPVLRACAAFALLQVIILTDDGTYVLSLEIVLSFYLRFLFVGLEGSLAS